MGGLISIQAQREKQFIGFYHTVRGLEVTITFYIFNTYE
jgi:hypothetical protein